MFSFSSERSAAAHAAARATAQRYCKLEQLPLSALSNSPTFNFGLGFAWKLLVQALVEELVEEQQVEYLERCLAADKAVEPTSGLKRFLTLIA